MALGVYNDIFEATKGYIGTEIFFENHRSVRETDRVDFDLVGIPTEEKEDILQATSLFQVGRIKGICLEGLTNLDDLGKLVFG